MTILDTLRTAFGGAARPAQQARAIAVGSIKPEGLTLELTHDALGAVQRHVGSAQRTFTGELFRLNEPGVEQAIHGASSRGVTQRFLVDPEATASVRRALPSRGVTSAGYAKMPFKNHSKGYVADSERALMTTGAFVAKTGTRNELVARFQGDAARALEELVLAGMKGSPKRLRAAADDAARYGIVVNEPVAGVQHLTGAVHDLIRNAKRDITISTKIFSDPTVRAAVADAERRGVRVRFTDIRAADSASRHMHANLIVADDSLYVGTAHFSPRGMGDMRLAYRRSRESGLVVHDAAEAAAMRQRLDDMQLHAYTPSEFERTRKAYAGMDVFNKLKADGASPAKLAAATPAYEQSQAAWREVRTEVKAARAADGITFTNPTGNAAT